MAVAEKLLDVQKNLPTLVKTAENPHFKNEYVPLEEVLDKMLPVLNERGLLLLQWPTDIDGQPALRTRIVDVEGGDSMEDTMPLMLDKSTPQGQGSALTYARRYAILTILGLVGEDDDDAERAEPKRPVRQRAAAKTDAPAAKF